jgi:prepilin-type N-terminal cleavage/methylation domain-containing protein
MPNLTRRGFTLVELLVTLVLLAIVSAVFYRTLMTNQRLYQKQTQAIDLQQNIRAAAALLPQELRELSASEDDIKAMSATSITFRARRWMGLMCQAPVTGGGLSGVTMMLRAQPFYGRAINTAIDSMFVRYEGDEGTRNDDGWGLARPTAVANALCPAAAGGGAGQLVTMNLSLGALPNLRNVIYAGSPVIGFETVTYGLYASGSDWYIGLTTSNGTQPLIGPLLPNGLSFSYYDSTGATTAVPARVARVDITVRATTVQPVRATAGGSALARVVDSVTTSVALRNNRRF